MEQSELLNPSAVSDLRREELLPVLAKARDVYQQLCDDNAELQSVCAQLADKEVEREKILNQVSAKTRRFWTIICILLLLVSIGVPPLLLCLLPWYFLRKNAYKRDRERNRNANEQEAQNFYASSIMPLNETKDGIQARLQDLESTVDWAKNIVTPEIFEAGAIEELYRLVENRRADTLKEALNLYDSSQHRARMESMQVEMLANSDIAAAEATKQTQLLQKTEKSTREAAAASKRTAASTYRTYQTLKRK